MAEQGRDTTGAAGLDELDVLLGLDVQEPATVVALANSAARIDLLAALRAARQRSGISDEELARRLGASALAVLDEVEHLGGDPHLSSVHRYADALGVALKLGAAETGGDLLGK